MLSSALYRFSPMLFVVLFLRASLDPALNSMKVGSVGLGALLNLLVVTYFLFVCLKERFLLPRAFFVVWGAFITIGLFSILRSPDKITSLRSFFAVLTYLSVFSMSFYFCRTKNDLAFIVKFIILSSLIPFAFTFLEFIFPSGSTTKNGFRLFGSFSHPNIYAFYLVLISSLCLFVLKQRILIFEQNFKKITKIILMFSVVFLILTKTRSAWLGFAVVIAVYGLLSNRRYLLYLVLTSFVAMMVPSVQERILEIFAGNSVDDLAFGESLNSYAWRKLVWAASWDYIITKPFFGHGYDTFSYYFLDFFPLKEKTSFDAHNTYVQIAFDMGFLGLIAYVYIFFSIIFRFVRYFKVDRQGGGLLLGLTLSYIVVGYSDNMLFYLSYNWYFWLLLGCFYFFSIRLVSHCE